VRYDGVPVRKCMCHQVVVRHLHERVYRSAFIVLGRYPAAYWTQLGEQQIVRLEEEARPTLTASSGELI